MAHLSLEVLMSGKIYEATMNHINRQFFYLLLEETTQIYLYKRSLTLLGIPDIPL